MNLSFPLQRAFLALPLENEAKWAFQEIQDRLSDYDRMFRFQNPQSPHLTIYFWNELMEIEYEDVMRKVEKIAERTSTFSYHVTEAATFNDRVLVLNIERSDELAKLKKLCPWPNVKPFSPHLTIARMRNPNEFRVHKKKIMKLLKDVEFDVPVDRIKFYAEVGGVRQTPVCDFKFP